MHSFILTSEGPFLTSDFQNYKVTKLCNSLQQWEANAL